MKLKALFCTMALAVVCSLSVAQERGTQSPWFVQGGLGASYSTGNAGIGHLISPAGQIAGGKYFSPVWGARLAIGGWQGRYGESGHSRSFYHGSATIDGLMNVSQLINAYPERPLDISLLLGAGYSRTFGEREEGSLIGRIGIQGGYRLNDAFDVNLEATFNGVSDRWNGLDDHGIDTYTNVLIGLTYKFGTSFKCATCISEAQVEYINECTNQYRQKVVEVEKIKIDTVYVEKPNEEKVVRGIRTHVVFDLAKTNIREDQMVNIVGVAQYLNEHPQAKLTVAGYADKGTGNTAINERLAKERAETVANCLAEKYGIARDRMIVTSMENEEQPFEVNDWNRVVILLAD